MTSVSVRWEITHCNRIEHEERMSVLLLKTAEFGSCFRKYLNPNARVCLGKFEILQTDAEELFGWHVALIGCIDAVAAAVCGTEQHN